jgi:hypothetical protein
MTMSIRPSTTWTEAASTKVNIGGVWKNMSSIKVNVSGVWKTVWPTATVTVSGETITGFSFGSTAYAGVYFYQDGHAQEGEVWKRTGASSYFQIDSSTDWIIPTTAATTTYRIYRNTWTGDTGFGTFNITTSPSAISSTRYIYVIDNSTGSGGRTISGTISIDDGTAGALDTGSYICSADREDF